MGRGQPPPEKQGLVMVEATASSGYLVHTCDLAHG
jgi:hypothetical protein